MKGFSLARNRQAGALIALLLVVATLAIGTATVTVSAADLANETADLGENDSLESIDVSVTANDSLDSSTTEANVTISNESGDAVLEETIVVDNASTNDTSYAVDDYDELNATTEYTVLVDGTEADVDDATVDFVLAGDGAGGPIFEGDSMWLLAGALAATGILMLGKANNDANKGRRRRRR